MKKSFTINPFCFTLFDGEGAATAGGAEAAPTTETPVTNPKKSGANVIYGKQEAAKIEPAAEASENVQEEPKPEDLRKKYDEFMNDEAMRNFYAEDTQKIINRRFKDSKALQEQLAKQDGVLQTLYQKYSVDSPEALSEALANDDSIWEEEALKNGMTVEQFKNFNKLQEENKKAHEFFEAQQRQQAARQQYAQWVGEAQQVKAEYPEFNLDAELQNPNFRGLIGQKNPQYQISMRQAYEICHMDDIKGSIQQQTAKNTEQRVVDNVRARGTRPTEGAAIGQSGIIVKDDVSKLTRKDREEIAKRVLRGEKISF